MDKYKRVKARYWYVVANPRGDVEAKSPPEFDESSLHYMKWVQHTQDKVHYHAILHFKDQKTMNMVKLYWQCSWINCSPLKSQEGAEKYNDNHAVTEGPYTFGNSKIGQGYRSDFEQLLCNVRSGMTFKECIMDQPGMIRYCSNVEMIMAKFKEPYMGIRAVAIIWGPQDTGKTSRFYGKYGRQNCFTVNLDDKNAWDEYAGQENVILEDLKPMFHSVDAIKRYITTDLTHVPSRYTNKPCCWKRVLITSNFDPDTWWTQEPDRGKVFSRVNYILNVKEKDTPDEKFPPDKPDVEVTEL